MDITLLFSIPFSMLIITVEARKNKEKIRENL